MAIEIAYVRQTDPMANRVAITDRCTFEIAALAALNDLHQSCDDNGHDYRRIKTRHLVRALFEEPRENSVCTILYKGWEGALDTVNFVKGIDAHLTDAACACAVLEDSLYTLPEACFSCSRPMEGIHHSVVIIHCDD